MTSEDSAQSPRLTTREAAELLGVKAETVYAYVSRGRLSSLRNPSGRGSTFDRAEVTALAGRHGGARPATGPVGGSLAVSTGLTLIEDDRYWFRGVDATELALHSGFEETAEWLWTGERRPGTRFTAPPGPLAAARAAVAVLPPGNNAADRLRIAAVAAGSADPLRFDLSPAAVLGTARAVVPTLVGALPPAGRAARDTGTVAARLWGRLTARRPSTEHLRVLDTALALLADHDLAASTLAVRVAASARAHPYAALVAGLGVMDGPLHGAASRVAHRMLAEVLGGRDAAAVVADELRGGGQVPGLGHFLYREDPRARVLLELLHGLPEARPALDAAQEVVAVAARHTDRRPNVDLALAVLALSTGMEHDAGETVFSVARTAGWMAHAMEEYLEPPLRMRPTGRYTGPLPHREPPAL